MSKFNKKNKPTVIVAIPVFNEQENIGRLLSEILTQTKKSFSLRAVWVISDGSTDKTVSVARLHPRPVKVFAYKKNLGKDKRINQIMKNNTADILVQIDSDMHLRSKNTLDILVGTLHRYQADLACAYHVPLPPRTFIEKLAHFGVLAWDSARKSLKEKGDYYYCEGGLRAFSKRFTKVFRLPNSPTSEDIYSFCFAKERNLRVVVVKRAKVYMHLASTYTDYVRQMKRFLRVPALIKSQFSEEIVSQYEIMTRQVKLRAFVKESMKHPFIAVGYLALQVTIKLQMPFYTSEKVWKRVSPNKSNTVAI